MNINDPLHKLGHCQEEEKKNGWINVILAETIKGGFETDLPPHTRINFWYQNQFSLASDEVPISIRIAIVLSLSLSPTDPNAISQHPVLKPLAGLKSPAYRLLSVLPGQPHVHLWLLMALGQAYE